MTLLDFTILYTVTILSLGPVHRSLGPLSRKWGWN